MSPEELRANKRVATCRPGHGRSTHVSGSMIEKLGAATQISLMEVGKAAASSEPPGRETVLSTAGLPRSVEQLSKVCGY